MESTLEQVKNGNITETDHFSCLISIGSVLEILLKYFSRNVLTDTPGVSVDPTLCVTPF